MSLISIIKRRKLFFLAAGLCFVFTVCRSVPGQSAGPEEGEETAVKEPAEKPEEFFRYPEISPDFENLPITAFGEIWGYLISGQEEALKAEYPLSDIGHFGAEVDAYGQLTAVPNRRRIDGFTGRVHMVVTCSGYGLSHFVLIEGSSRRRLVRDLVEAAKPYDGLQIDFEYVPKRDGESFHSFLADLRAELGDKIFTIALPAREKTLNNDVYDYTRIAPWVDRILVMAYDEHWSTSEPGPVASMNWCRSVAAYSLQVVGPEKLIMGIPFYGRAWGNPSPSRAYVFSSIERIKQENKVTEIYRENGVPTFTYEIPVTVKVYYEDDYSLSTRFELYRGLGVKSIGFWRLGQENPAIWRLLNLTEKPQ
jgi:spore germination protein YaaH